MLLFVSFRVVIKAEAPYIKMVSEQFDRCHGTLLQYVDFLCSAVAPASAYGHLVPSLDDLIHLYHLDPEVLFLLPCAPTHAHASANSCFHYLTNYGDPSRLLS